MIINKDCLEALKELPDNSIDCIVTDPPYGLSFMGKKWDYDVPSVEIWSECLRVLKPGGYLLAFAGTRTQHRMAVRIEDAGFEIRDMIAWVYGSGFPKSLNIGKAINKIDGVEFESKPAEGVGFMNNDTEDGYHPTINQLVQKGESSARAKEWEGWGTALKPALEPITVARKPIEGTVAENCLKHGVGGINIDKCRVVAYNGLNDNDNKGISTKKGTGESSLFELQSMQQGNESLEELSKEIKTSTDLWEDMQGKVNNGQQGLDLERGNNKETRRVHSEQSDEQTNSSRSNGETYGQKITQERNSSSQKSQEGRQQNREFGSDKQGAPHNEISQQEGQENGQTPIGRWPSNLIHDGSEEVLELFPETKSGSGIKNPKNGAKSTFRASTQDDGYFTQGDSGSAARFFYCAKASKSERNMGLDGFEEREGENGNKWTDQDYRRGDERPTTKRQNFHPTVKPIKLMEYLVNLVSKEGHTVLDPFCGSGTTGIACKKLNRNFIGIERDEEYCKIAEARINAV